MDIDPTFIQALGWALLHFVWQGLGVGAATALLLFALRHASPRRRYAACMLALFVCLALPLAHLAWLLSAGLSGSDAQAELPPDWLLDLQAQLPSLVTAWSLGVGLMSLRLALGLAWVARLRRRVLATPPVPPEWQARFEALARRMELGRRVLLRALPEASSPFTVGSWRPMVLLPAALLSGLPAPLLEALLAHELAHVRRQDYLANLLQSVVEALLFFHPVVWWLSTRARQEREQVADELAATVLDDPRRLAEALHALSQQTPGPAEARSPSLILSARGGHLYQRIERLLVTRPQTASWKLALPALALACTSLLVQAGTRHQAHGATAVAAPATAPAAAAPSVVSPLPLLKMPLNARHALVLEEGTGKVLYAKDAEAVVPIASLTKLMTAMVVLDAKQNPAETLRITADDVDSLKHSRSLVRVGSEMSRHTALEMALMASENRAAAALARTFPGGFGAFMQALQAKIRSLGLSNTALVEPTGLSPSNTSTAQDVARIAEAAARYPEIERITSVRTAKVDINGRPRELHNTNRLVGSKGWDIRLSKTGYTDEAGRCLTMRMNSAGKKVTVVLLDADGSAQRLRDAARIRQSLVRLPGHAS